MTLNILLVQKLARKKIAANIPFSRVWVTRLAYINSYAGTFPGTRAPHVNNEPSFHPITFSRQLCIGRYNQLAYL